MEYKESTSYKNLNRKIKEEIKDFEFYIYDALWIFQEDPDKTEVKRGRIVLY